MSTYQELITANVSVKWTLCLSGTPTIAQFNIDRRPVSISKWPINNICQNNYKLQAMHE